MNEKQKQALINRYERLIISDENLREAKKYCEKLFEIINKKENDIIVVKALIVAIITTYSIPFSKNKNKHSKNSEINKKSIQDFTDEQSALHQKITNYRNRNVAHADSIEHDVSFEIYEKAASVIKRKIIRDLKIEELEMLISMINKSLKYIVFECQRLQDKLPVGTEI